MSELFKKKEVTDFQVSFFFVFGKFSTTRRNLKASAEPDGFVEGFHTLDLLCVSDGLPYCVKYPIFLFLFKCTSLFLYFVFLLMSFNFKPEHVIIGIVCYPIR